MTSLPLLLFVMLVLIVTVSWIYRIWGFKGLYYERYFEQKHCIEGEEILLVEKLQNRKWLPMFWVRMEATISANFRFHQQEKELHVDSGKEFQYHRSIFSLMPFTQITRRHTVSCQRRGCYRFNSLFMAYGDPFGFTTYTKNEKLDIELLVFPKPLSKSEIKLPSHSWQGDVTVKRWIVEDPFLISGVREYRVGDTLSKVNWKATARSNKLQVNQMDYTSDQNLMIVLNFDMSKEGWNAIENPAPIEYGIRYVITLAQYAVKHGMKIGFLSNGQLIDGEKMALCRLKEGSGKAQLRLLNEILAKFIVKRTIPFEAMVEQEVERRTHDYDYIILTSYVSEKLQAQFKKLERNGNAVKVVPLLQEAPSHQRGEAVG